MRKIKKSVKIIISLACVLAVAIVGVVTAVLITNSRKGKGKNPPNVPAYALTVSQKELGKEISDSISTAISDKKLQPVEYGSALSEKLSVSKISYLDKNVAWSKSNQYSYKAYILDDEGRPTDLLQAIKDKDLLEREDYISANIDFAGKNHFSVLYTYSSTEYVRIVCTVENNDVVLNKSFELIQATDTSCPYYGDDVFWIAFDNDYFVVMLRTGGVTGTYHYEMFDYLSDYTGYESFKIGVADELDMISCVGGIFYVDGQMTATKTDDGEFGLIESSQDTIFSLTGGTIVETKTEYLTPVSGAELVDGKYIVYSYKLVVGNNEKTIELPDASKITAVPYSGEKYFGIFIQSVDVTGKLNETGTMIYFDYELNTVVKYSARSASLSKIFYVGADSFVTGDGVISGKTNVVHNKIYDYESNGYEFVSILGNGDIVLKNKNGSMNIFNTSLSQSFNVSFDEIVSRISDDKLIFVKNSKYYLYDIKNRTASQIDYEKTAISNETSMYFVKNAGGTSYSLYAGNELIDGNVSSYSTGDNYLTFTSNSVEKSYYFVDKLKLVENIEDVTFSAANTSGGSVGSLEPSYGAPAIEPYDSIFDEEPEWYEYEDKFLSVAEKKDGVSTGATVYKATHCIQMGHYSKTDYVDYLEINYVGENGGNKSTYAPYRVYYRVDISSGNPIVTIVSMGHQYLSYRELTDEIEYKPSRCINVNGKMYEISDLYSFYGDNVAPQNNTPWPDVSYDYVTYPGGFPQSFYYYTHSTDAETGFFFHEGEDYATNRPCTAEVYGNSIRVSLYFTFVKNGSHDIKTNGLSFGQTMEIPGVSEDYYYNDLYYQSVVVGYLSEDVNYYEDIMVNPESGDSSIVTEYFFKSYLDNPAYDYNSKDRTNQQLIYSETTSSAIMTACISSKTYISPITKNETTNMLEYGYTKLYLGGKNFKTNITGGQLVGITTLNEPNYNNINIKSLYSSDSTSGSRNYFDERVEFRLIPIGQTSAAGEENDFNIVKYTYLNYDATEDSENYSINIQNQDYIYCAGGLNSFRYIYCVFEPQMFYVDIDYNPSGDEASFGNEINYLQSYASLGVGMDYKNDYVNYNKSWVYVNALETGTDESKVFGTYDNANNDKYWPYDFENTDTRAEPIDLAAVSAANKEAYKKKYENSARIFEYKNENQRYFYIVIDGVKYYFQHNFKDTTNANRDYSKPYTEYFSSDDMNLFTKAYKTTDAFESTAIDGYGKIELITSGNYYDAFFVDPKDKTLSPGQTGREGVYDEGVDFVYLRIKKAESADGSYIAYYYQENKHERTNVVYEGYYNFIDDGTGEGTRKVDEVNFNDDEGTKYKISERFSFYYSDNLFMTRLPQHTHYDFMGWKVILQKNDGTTYDYLIDTSTLNEINLNLNTNLSLEHPFLPEYENSVRVGYRFFDFWRTIDAEGKITWNNLVDNPIKLVAQWQPKKCDVKAVLYVPQVSGGATKYLGLRHDYGEGPYGYSLSNNFDIADGATSAPIFKKGTTVLDVNKDGILDFSDDTKFDYSLDITFFTIGTLMANNSFSQNIVNTTGLSCQFMGWAFQQKTANPGESADTFIAIDPMLNSQPKDQRAKDTKIDEYIGDTTTITIYAYYATSRYNFFLRFYPMGGATLAEAGANKSYYSNYDYTTGTSGNGNIFNALRNPVVYNITINDFGTANTSIDDKYTSDITNNAVHIMGLTGTSYGIDYRDDGNPFFTGNGVKFTITLNEQYYARTVVINNLVLKDDSNKLDAFKLIFTYNYTDEGGAWTGTCVSQLNPGKTLKVTPITGGEFRIGKNNGAYNEGNNIITIEQPNDDTVGTKTWTISIAHLSNPGTFKKMQDYNDQLLEGNDGFTLEVHPASYTIETESVTVSTQDSENNPSAGPFKHNNAMLVSSQPLTNAEGYDISAGSPVYIWLGTSRYMFDDEWDQNILSGYFRLNPNGTTVAVEAEGYNYDQFIHQHLQTNGEIYVYYDRTEARIYYPARYAGANIDEIAALYTSNNTKMHFLAGEDYYYINFGVDGYTKDTFEGGYCLAHLNQNSGMDVEGAQAKFGDSNYAYKPGASTIAVYVDFSGRLPMVYYNFVKDQSSLIGYNNTRVLAIDPDQEQVYMGAKPSDSEESDYYDLNYYLSSITIGTTTISFEILSRNLIESTTEAATKFYGLLNLDLMKGNNYVSQGTLVPLSDIHDWNEDIAERGGDPNTAYVINYFGDNYIIQDAYIININEEAGKVGATKYYFYLTRSARGFTRYFLIYDESTTKLSDLKLNYSISLSFKEFEKNLEITVKENDLYDPSNRSFEIMYAEKGTKYTTGSSAYKYNFDYTIDYEDIIVDATKKPGINTFYQLDNQFDVPFKTIITSTTNIEDYRKITSMKWRNTYDFTPAANRRLKISAKSGYIINSLKVYIGTKDRTNSGNDAFENIISFEFVNDIEKDDDNENPISSLDYLYYYDAGKNYAYSSVEDNKLVSYFKYKINKAPENQPAQEGDTINVGYRVIANQTFGLFYSSFYDTNWGFGHNGEFNFDHLYMMLAGLYEDVKIEFETTSYSEFLFESGAENDDYNPLLRVDEFQKELNNYNSNNPSNLEVYDGYYSIPLSSTYLFMYTMKYENPTDEELVLDKETLMNAPATGSGKIFTIRYYYDKSQNNIMRHTIRIIFFGTGSKIRYGLHFLSTHKDYSVYFTNGRYYNEEMGSTGETPFEELEAFSGRTSNNNAIVVDDVNPEKDTRAKTNKLVYMFTGKLHEEGADGRYTGYYVNSSYIVRNESSFKFLTAVTAFVNEVGVKTESYLYNHTMTLDQTLRTGFSSNENTKTTTRVDNSVEENMFGDGIYNGENYKYLHINGGNEIIFNKGANFYHYQLDTLHKRYSWFNDTVLSNIQLYSYLDHPDVNSTEYKPKVWANRNEENESELTRVELGGLDFNWRYYEIPGYYLKNILIKIADIQSYFMIDISALNRDSIMDGVNDNELTLIKEIKIYNPNAIDGRSFSYRFNLYYYKYNKNGYSYSYYQLYPIFGEEKDDGHGNKVMVIDEFESVSLMANDITVGFVSNAYNYDIVFNNYDFDGKVSTGGTILDYATSGVASESQSIYYDSLTKINHYQTMIGYTFIGWGSETYYNKNNENSPILRFVPQPDGDTQTPSYWDSTSVWYDTTKYFVQPGLSAQKNMELYLSLYSIYEESDSAKKPHGAFYTNGGYIVSDTGFKQQGLNSQNYNFYADYIAVFARHIAQSHLNYQDVSPQDEDVKVDRVINLYAIWKANTYAIQFDVNNTLYNDTVYIDYETKAFVYEFTSDKVGFRDKTVTGVNQEVRLCYVTFDTNNWYSLSGTGGILMYSAKNSSSGNSPYSITPLVDDTVAKLAVDMFGYSWLGWYYTKVDYIEQGLGDIEKETRVFDSYYSKVSTIRGNSPLDTIPVFNQTFIDKGVTVYELDFDLTNTDTANAKKFDYYGRHKEIGSTLSSTTGYVCFYYYGQYDLDGNNEYKDFGNASNQFDVGADKVKYICTADYLNSFRTYEVIVDETPETPETRIRYANEYYSPIIMSYYDTFMGENCYSIKSNAGKYSLTLSSNAADLRRVKLFANWSQNEYQLIFNDLSSGSTQFDWDLGSSPVESDRWLEFAKANPTAWEHVWFNNKEMSAFLLDKYQPTRIGYDFLGWSYNYIPLNTTVYQSLISTVNTPNQYSYLCKELLAAYASMNGAPNTDSLNSNVLMLVDDRTADVDGATWLLNSAEGEFAERLGDAEEDNDRFVYVFPIWKAQTFSITISLNITAENLKNLHEKDSSFAIGLYNSADPDCKTFTGVNSKYYTFNTVGDASNTLTGADVSNYYYYYNDIVANVCFEIEFDKPFSTATCSFGGKTYYLKDLVLTSAGYYFLGLMAQNDEDDQYVLKNLLRTTLEYRDGLVHHDNKDHDEAVLNITDVYDNEAYLFYSEITGCDENGNNERTTSVFDLAAYNAMKDEKHQDDKNTTVKSELKGNDYELSNSSMYSSNFGYISFAGKKYKTDAVSTTMPRTYSIMSERDGSEYYLFIIHNNVKYYVVYYNSTGTSFEDTITFDRTYLYYNVKDASGNVVNKYIIRFDSSGSPYYVNDTFKKKVDLTLLIAIYTTKTNKLNVITTGTDTTIPQYGPTTPNGTLAIGCSWNSATKKVTGSIASILGSGNFELINKPTREFTLYADWEIRTLKTVIANGNNNNALVSGGTPDSNVGLEGFYQINDKTNGNNSITTTDDNTKPELGVDLSYEYYSNVDHLFTSKFAGRYLSELTLEFDTLIEEGSGDITTLSKRHNTIVFKFSWDNEKFKITIDSVTYNGLLVASAVSYVTKTDYVLTLISGIDILSMIDENSLNSDSAGSGIEVYKKNHNNFLVTTSQQTDYTNQVAIDFKEIMASMKFTCKYSIQTYKVEVYNVVADSKFITNYDTSFSSVTAMHLSSNYYPENRGMYGVPFISTESFTSNTIPTISTDCAKVQTMSYNVPFYYFVTDSSKTENARSNYNLKVEDYGLGYIYDNIYYSGTSGVKVDRDYGDLNASLSSSYTFVNWLTRPEQNGAIVSLSRYEQEAPIVQNTVIYGYYYRGDAPTKVLFYYWNNETRQYVQYTQNEQEYTSGTPGSCISSSNKITKLPSPSIATWYGGGAKQFVGYVYFTNEIFTKIVAQTLNEDYDSLKYQASNTFTETSGDIYSAFYYNRIVSAYESVTHNMSDLYNTEVAGRSIFDMFSSRITVHDYKYFTKTASINGNTVKVLDGARCTISLDERKFYKDLKVLNVDTELPAGLTTYAIPLYEDMNVNIKDIFVYKDEATITSNTNMIQSCVFETNSNYTIFYDPKDVQIAVSSSYTLGESDILGSSTIYGLDKVYDMKGALRDYRQKKFEISGTSYVYAFYRKYDSNGNPTGVPFFISNAYKVTSGQVRVQTKVEMYDSPLNIILIGDNLEAYRVAYEAIEEDSSITSVVEKTNRKRAVYIMLQLMQCGILSFVSSTSIITYGYGGSRPDVGNATNYSVAECIKAINYYHQDSPIYNCSHNCAADKIYCDDFSIFRLAYAIAYDFTVNENINNGAGLYNLFGTNGLEYIDAYYEYTSFEVNRLFDESNNYNHIRPGDIMVSYRHNYSREIVNVEGDDKLVYYYEPTTSEPTSAIFAKSVFAMYFGSKNDAIYFGLKNDERNIEVAYRTTNYQHLEEMDDGSIYQENDTYRKFIHGSGSSSLNNGLETGYYTRNAVTKITQGFANGEYFLEGNRKLKIYYNGYYFTESDIDNENDSAIKKFYDEAEEYWKETTLKAWQDHKQVYDKYQEWLADKNPDKPPVAIDPSMMEDPGPEPTFTKPTLEVAVNAVTSNPEYYELETFSVVTEGKGAYLQSEDGDKISSKFYRYVEGHQYYVVDEDGERTKLASVSSSTYTGYDQGHNGINETYWVVHTGLNRIFTRWTSFIGSLTHNGGIESYDEYVSLGYADGPVLGGGSYPDGLPEDTSGSTGDETGGGIGPGGIGSGSGAVGGVLGEEYDPKLLPTPLQYELNERNEQRFRNISKFISNDIYRMTLIKVALQIIQAGLRWDEGYHWYGFSKDGYNHDPRDKENKPGQHAYYNLRKSIDRLNEKGRDGKSIIIHTDCCGYVRMTHCIAAMSFAEDYYDDYSCEEAIKQYASNGYNGNGGYEGDPFNSSNISSIKPGDWIEDWITGNKSRTKTSARHVAMYMYTGDDGTVYYTDQDGWCEGRFTNSRPYYNADQSKTLWSGYCILGEGSDTYYPNPYDHDDYGNPLYYRKYRFNRFHTGWIS